MRKLTKVAAVVLSAVMTFSMAFAVDPTTTINNETTKVDSGNFMSDFDAAKVDPTQAKSVTITFEADPTDGFGGGFVLSTKANNWKAVEWGNDGSEKEIIAKETGKANEYTITREVPADFFKDHKAGEEGEYAQIAVQQWWGAPIKITEVAVTLADNSVYKFSEGVKNDAPANDAPANDAPANDAPANDAPAKDDKTGDATNVLALAGIACIALCGVAYASKKRA